MPTPPTQNIRSSRMEIPAGLSQNGQNDVKEPPKRPARQRINNSVNQPLEQGMTIGNDQIHEQKPVVQQNTQTSCQFEFITMATRMIYEMPQIGVELSQGKYKHDPKNSKILNPKADSHIRAKNRPALETAQTDDESFFDYRKNSKHEYLIRRGRNNLNFVKNLTLSNHFDEDWSVLWKKRSHKAMRKKHELAMRVFKPPGK